MFRGLRHKKSFLIIRNLIAVELVAYGIFVLLAIPFHWSKIYLNYFGPVAYFIPFNVLELIGLAAFQIVVILFVVTRSLRDDNIGELIKSGEHERLEFKTTMRWDVKRGQVNKELEKGVMKTVAAFMNSQGGQLVIGVDDQRGINGIGHDFDSLIKKSRDGFENHFNNVFGAMIGPEFRRHVRLSFHELGDKEVCLVQVERARRPAYLKTDNGEDFFIRTGNATTSLKVSQAAAYLADWHQR